MLVLKKNTNYFNNLFLISGMVLACIIHAFNLGHTDLSLDLNNSRH